jgi:single-stranded-DNA-specific exonuclease
MREAEKTAAQLCEINRMRQEEENSIIEDALEKIQNEFDFEKDTVIVLAEENWHHGVIGIVSSRITERYGLPSILISFDENGIAIECEEGYRPGG